MPQSVWFTLDQWLGHYRNTWKQVLSLSPVMHGRPATQMLILLLLVIGTKRSHPTTGNIRVPCLASLRWIPPWSGTIQNCQTGWCGEEDLYTFHTQHLPYLHRDYIDWMGDMWQCIEQYDHARRVCKTFKCIWDAGGSQALGSEDESYLVHVSTLKWMFIYW